MIADLKKAVLLGLAASLILSFIEWADLNVTLTPVFASFRERLIFTAYLSLNLLVGAVIGLTTGVFALVLSSSNNLIWSRMAGGAKTGIAYKLAPAILVYVIAGLLLNQQPHAHGYVVGLMIEAQKLPYLYGQLLPYEKVLSCLIVIGLLAACSLVWLVAGAVNSMKPLLRGIWLLSLAASMAVAYYIDSRYEVQLYEYTLHRSMFLLAIALAMALTRSLYLSSPYARRVSSGQGGPRVKLAFAVAAAVLVSSVVFTFLHFGRNQNVKVQMLSRTTQAKQHIKLLQWALDFDRDGYSPYLGGGDADDRRAEINPDQVEALADGVDNNVIGGDLTQDKISEWLTRHAALHKTPGRAARRYNIVYIFIDALRADHLGAYGYARPTSPNLDKLAARSALFKNGFSPSANTFESAARFMKSSYWDAQVESWTEVLARSGYNMMLFPQRRLSMLQRYVKGMQVAQGAEGKGLKETVDLAIQSIGDAPQGTPFCAYIYAVDPHSPYAKHKEFDFGQSRTDLYDGEIAFTDHHFGRLFDALESSGRLKDTVVVVMADHAESLGERGVYRHSSQLYSDQTHVPVIFYVPDLPARQVEDYVSTIDLGTTLLDVVGLDCPQSYAGVSLLPSMRGEATERPGIYGEQTLREKEFPNIPLEQYPQPVNKKYMLITQDGYKLIYNRNIYTFELFDLKRDPNEQHNLYDSEREKAEDLKGQLGRFIDIVLVSRPAAADESKYFFGDERPNAEEDGQGY